MRTFSTGQANAGRIAATSRTTPPRQDHAGKSGARDGAWNAAGELKFARM